MTTVKIGQKLHEPLYVPRISSESAITSQLNFLGTENTQQAPREAAGALVAHLSSAMRSLSLQTS